jgi:hypothetical protein
MMKINKHSLIFSILHLFIFFIGIVQWINNDDKGIFNLFCFLTILIIIGYALSKWSRDFKKLMEALPSDNKLITPHIAAVDIGNYRFIYRLYEKGNNLNPANKTYLSMEVGIPFPSGNSVDDEQSLKESIKSDLQGIIDRLQEEGLLTLFNHIVKDSNEFDNEENSDEEPVTWTGQPFALEFLLKRVTSALLSELQKNIIAIICKYKIQDYSWFVCNYTSIGKEYRYHKGNMLQSSVLVTHDFNKLYLNYKQCYTTWTQEIDTSINEDEYKELFYAASHNRGEGNLNLREMKRITRNLFKGLPNYKIMATNNASDCFSVNLEIKEISSACTYTIVASNGLWWFYSQGRFDNIYPISFDNESSACGFILTILQGYAGQNMTK